MTRLVARLMGRVVQLFGGRSVKPVAALLIALMGLVVAAASSPVSARTVLDLDSKAQPARLNDWGDFWLEPGGQRTASQVASGADGSVDWQATRNDAIYPLTTSNALWIRFTVPPAPDAERWYLELPSPSINRLSLFTLDAAGQWNEQKTGDLVPVSSWPVPHRHPLMPIAVSAEEPSSYLLRLENGHSMSAPVQFISESYLSRSEQRVSLILGIFFGLAGLAAMVSLISALSLRDTAYGFYALTVTLSALTQASLTGIAGLHLWPHWAWWNDVSASILPTLELAAALMFISAVVSLPERSLRLHRTLVGVAAFGVLTAMTLAFIPIERRTGLFISYIFLPQFVGGWALVWAWRRGDRFAPWLMLGFMPAVASGALLLARTAGWLPISALTQHSAQIAVAIELPIIMVILMLRSQQRRENTRRLQGLDRVDPSSGLINGHVFAERLMRMLARSQRLRHQSAVMLIDITNTAQTQRDFGRKAADDLPLHVAERLLSTAREIDSAARLSERRFGMLVEGPISAEEAATLGPRIVARCLMPYKGLHVDCVAQVRIAYAMVPEQGSDAQEVLQRLDERLAAAPGDDKRAVFMLGEVLPPPRRRRSRATNAGPMV